MTPTKTDLTRLLKAAEAAGDAAAKGSRPTPMHVVQHANPLDDNSPIVRRYAPVMGGVCGFASVIIRPANSRIANVAKARYGDRKGYALPGSLSAYKHFYGGLSVNVGGYGQSLERKSAYAGAFARVLSDAGYDTYVDSRMD